MKRNIRRKNEQVFLSPVARGFDIYRVSSAAKLTGLDLPARHDLKITPYVLASVNKDYTVARDQVVSRVNPFEDRNIGVDAKWGVRPNLTADFTLNTDFAQVEADEEQVNLTRFDLFFPEKRPFFLENASVFQFGLLAHAATPDALYAACDAAISYFESAGPEWSGLVQRGMAVDFDMHRRIHSGGDVVRAIRIEHAHRLGRPQITMQKPVELAQRLRRQIEGHRFGRCARRRR